MKNGIARGLWNNINKSQNVSNYLLFYPVHTAQSVVRIPGLQSGEHGLELQVIHNTSWYMYILSRIFFCTMGLIIIVKLATFVLTTFRHWLCNDHVYFKWSCVINWIHCLAENEGPLCYTSVKARYNITKIDAISLSWRVGQDKKSFLLNCWSLLL